MEFILDRLRQKGLVAKLKKCKVNYPQLQALGHVITARGRCPNPKHIEAVLDIAVPECAGDVLHILGLLNYNRNYIPSLASEAAVLSDLLKADINITEVWQPEVHGEALRRLKLLLTTAPFL